MESSNDENNIIILPKNSQTLHPLTCNWISNKSSNDPKNIKVNITKIKYENKKFSIFDFNKCNSLIKSNEKYKSYLYIPPLGINSLIILDLYNIYTIEDLEKLTIENIREHNIFTISRLVNAWIINNYSIVKKHNKIFIDIVYSLIMRFPHSFIKKLSTKIDLMKQTKKFINEYFINLNLKNFNLLEDYFNFLLEKYLIKK